MAKRTLPQPTLFPLVDDARPATERSAAERYLEPSLFSGARPARAPNLYETDGRCHNANVGTYGHECGKPAAWIGETRNGFRSGFCGDCKETGDEARQCVRFYPLVREG